MLPSRPKRSGLFVAILALPLLLAGYLLGSGPAAWLVIYDRISFQTYSTVYAPLTAVEVRCKPVWYVARWYRELFIPKHLWPSDYMEVRCGS